MSADEHHLTFGPVPSRRLGQSLGINNVTTKTCSYACVYCQVGPTTEGRIEPGNFFSPAQICAAVSAHLNRIRSSGQRVDYLTFVPDGEPTLDKRLGESIQALRRLEVPIAVITNASLLSRPEVRARLAAADLVSVKVDSVNEPAWRRINRPHRDLQLKHVLQGIREFATGYTGTLFTETMLIAGLNDSRDALEATAKFIAGLAPHTAWLAVPVRPPAVAGVRGTDERGLLRAHEIYAARLARVGLLTGPEPGEFAHTGDARTDLLAITAVHPMRETDVRRLLAEDHADWGLVETLLSEGALRAVNYEGQRFYMRPVR
jgi:wyosine [tRNA(Phe)-imidazoG37] synthetase (radical SAM superfamily)